MLVKYTFDKRFLTFLTIGVDVSRASRLECTPYRTMCDTAKAEIDRSIAQPGSAPAWDQGVVGSNPTAPTT